MKFTFAASVALCFSAGGMALAQTPSPPPTPAVSAAAVTPDKSKPGSLDEVICRREEVTGTMMEKHVCKTRRDWIALDGAYPDTSSTMRARADMFSPNAH